jgi:hypothetical protein
MVFLNFSLGCLLVGLYFWGFNVGNFALGLEISPLINNKQIGYCSFVVIINLPYQYSCNPFHFKFLGLVFFFVPILLSYNTSFG